MPTYASRIIAAATLEYWRLNGNGNNEITANDLTLYGGVNADLDGVPNIDDAGAVRFGGTNAIATASGATGSAYMEFWMMVVRAPSSEKCLVQSGTISGKINAVHLNSDLSLRYYYIRDSGGPTYYETIRTTSAAIVQLNTWHFIRVVPGLPGTTDDKKPKIYVDDVEYMMSVDANTSDSLVAGSDAQVADTDFDVVMSEVAIGLVDHSWYDGARGIGDGSYPYLKSATGLNGHILVEFNKTIHAPELGDTANYSLTPSETITVAAVIPTNAYGDLDRRFVLLTVPTLNPNFTYTLQARVPTYDTPNTQFYDGIFSPTDTSDQDGPKAIPLSSGVGDTIPVNNNQSVSAYAAPIVGGAEAVSYGDIASIIASIPALVSLSGENPALSINLPGDLASVDTESAIIGEGVSPILGSGDGTTTPIVGPLGADPRLAIELQTVTNDDSPTVHLIGDDPRLAISLHGDIGEVEVGGQFVVGDVDIPLQAITPTVCDGDTNPVNPNALTCHGINTDLTFHR